MIKIDSRPRTRRRGRGSIQDYATTKGVRWRYQVRVPMDPEQPDLGDKKHSRGGFRTLRDADDALQETLKRIKNHEKLTSKPPKIGDYATAWVSSLRLADSTVHGYEKVIRNHIRPQLGEITIDRLLPSRINHHYKELLESGRKDKGNVGKPLSANTVRKTHVILGAILDAAILDGFLSVNPAKNAAVKPPRPSEIKAAKPEQVTWTAEELNTVLRWLRDDLEDDHYPLWCVYAMTGLRRSEALALKWQDIDHAAKSLTLLRTLNTRKRGDVKILKTGATRRLDLDDETLDALKKHKASRAAISLALCAPDAYIFSDENGDLPSPSSVTSMWSRRLDWLQQQHPRIRRVSLHGLRHTHATQLMSVGVPPKVVQERLGHSNIGTTLNIYSHVTPTMQRDAVDKLTSLLAAG